MNPKKRTLKKINLKKKTNSLYFVKNTPVLPVVTKNNLKEILELLEDLTDDHQYFIDAENEQDPEN